MDYIEATVRQTIPADCLAPIERWLLTRIFKTEERGDSLVFYGCWDYNTAFSQYFAKPGLAAEVLDLRRKASAVASSR